MKACLVLIVATLFFSAPDLQQDAQDELDRTDEKKTLCEVRQATANSWFVQETLHFSSVSATYHLIYKPINGPNPTIEACLLNAEGSLSLALTDFGEGDDWYVDAGAERLVALAFFAGGQYEQCITHALISQSRYITAIFEYNSCVLDCVNAKNQLDLATSLMGSTGGTGGGGGN